MSSDFRGRGIAELLLLDAFRRVLAHTRGVASAVVVVDAKDDRAREFYLRVVWPGMQRCIRGTFQEWKRRKATAYNRS